MIRLILATKRAKKAPTAFNSLTLRECAHSRHLSNLERRDYLGMELHISLGGIWKN